MSDSHGHGDGDGKHKKHKKHHGHGAHAEHEHEEGWIVSFADNVLLMMGFFVILLAMNMGPKGTSDAPPSGAASAEDRVLDVAIAVREAFHNPVNMGSSEPNDQPLIRRMKERTGSGANRSKGPSGRDEKNQTIRPSDYMGEDALVQFAPRESVLSQSALKTLEEVTERTRDSRWMVEVRGHASRWESWGDVKKARDLSYERAWAVGNELVRLGLRWEQIRLVSSGDSAPAVPRARTAEDGQMNQRTEVLVLRELMPADEYGRE
jgi:outer membrane protein OmpA-like peptidoglycan-associated protein